MDLGKSMSGFSNHHKPPQAQSEELKLALKRELASNLAHNMYANTMPTHSKSKVLMSINLVSSSPAGEDLL